MPAPYSYPNTPPDYQETAAALSYIPVPSSHDEWYRYAIAIKSALGEDGFDLWDDWSRRGESYDPRQTRAVWKSANPRAGGITWRTLMKSARENGYKSERRYTPPDAAQVAAQKQREREQAARAEQEQAAQHRAAERTAYGIWTNARPADPSHPYLQNKGINNPEILRSIRQNEYNGQRQLVIPLYQDNKLVSVQTINEDGGKRILKGSKKSGSHTAIGSLKDETHKGAVAVAEGWATAASIRQATGLPVIAAIDKGNMSHIAENLARTLPPSTAVIFAADNDPSGGGLEAAQKAAALLGSRGFAVQPEFKAEHIAQFQAKYGARNETKNRENLPTDFNDLHLLAGENSVRARFAPVLERIRGQRAVENGHQQETDFMQPEIPAAMQPQTAEISAQKTVNPNTAAAETAAVSLPQTQDHDMAQQPENAQPETPLSSKRLEILQNSLAKKQAAFDDRLQGYFDDVKSANGQPLNDKRNGQATMTRWNRQNDALRNAQKSIEKTERAIEREQEKIANVARHPAPPFLQGMIDAGEISQWRKYPNRFFVKGGGKARLIWNENKQTLSYSRPDEITPEEWKVFAAAAKKAGELLEAFKQHTKQQLETTAPEAAITPTAAAPAVAVSVTEQQMAQTTEMQPKTEQAAATQEMAQPQIATIQPETQPQFTKQPENAIEYGEITQEQQSEPQAAEDIMQQNAARYPETIQAAPPEAAARQPETSIPPQAQQQPEIPPRAERQPETETPETPSAASPETPQKPKPILDFDYATPAGFEARYLRVEGKYLDLDNRQTVMFQDKGAKIKTARADAQTIRDMLDTAQAKNWDSIKISGSRDFKRRVWLEAELRGIASTGYTPSKADLALRDQMLQERQRNSIEADVRAERRPPPLQMPEAAPRQPESAQSSPKPPPQAGERILAHGAAPYLHKQDNSMNYFVRLQAADGSVREKWGVLLSEALRESGADTGDLIRLEDKGKQPVTVQRQVKDAQGNVIGSEKIQTERNVFAIDVLERASVRQPENPIHFDKVPLPDEAVHLRSETEKLQKRAETPEQHAAADRAAADVETAVAEQRAQPDAGQIAGNMEAARNAYQQKATQLSAEAKSNLDAVHALIAKAAENMSDRQSADKIMLNFYRNAPDYMRGTDFELGKYLSSTTQQTKTQQSSAPQQNDDMEIDR